MELIDVASDPRDYGSRVLVCQKMNVDSCLKEAESSHVTAASKGSLKCLPEVFGHHLIIHGATEFNI